MMATAILIVQAAQLAGMAVWLFMGLRDNLTAPRLNMDSITEILGMDAMRRTFPQYYDMLEDRRLTDPARQRLLFRAIVAAEVAVTAALALGAGLLALAACGLAGAGLARAAALLAVAGFCGLWTAFLIGGNHFVIWLCHGNAQRTHFDLLLWGLGTQVLLVAG